MPAAWSSLPGAGHPVDPGWLRRFEDESLNQLVLEAERHNPDLKIAASQVAQAVEQTRIAASAARPNASLGMGARRTRQNFIGFPDFGGGGNGPGGGDPPAEETVLQNLSNSFGPSLDIAWELDVWGRVRQSEAAAIAQAEAAAMDFAAARTSLVAQVAKAWFALAESEEHNRLADETLRATEETERALGDRFRAGQAEGQIVGAQYRLAKSDTEAARAALEQADAELAFQQADLAADGRLLDTVRHAAGGGGDAAVAGDVVEQLEVMEIGSHREIDPQDGGFGTRKTRVSSGARSARVAAWRIRKRSWWPSTASA